MKTINIRDVAREAGTSISSVSRCLNDIPGVAAPVRKGFWRQFTGSGMMSEAGKDG